MAFAQKLFVNQVSCVQRIRLQSLSVNLELIKTCLVRIHASLVSRGTIVTMIMGLPSAPWKTVQLVSTVKTRLLSMVTLLVKKAHSALLRIFNRKINVSHVNLVLDVTDRPWTPTIIKTTTVLMDMSAMQELQQQLLKNAIEMLTARLECLRVVLRAHLDQ
jgi:hypothetical protein